MSNPKLAYLKSFEGQTDIVILDETLQKLDDPVAELKKVAGKAVIVVPAEYNWPPQFKPLTNPEHKRVYDADLLAEHLSEAGLEPYILRQIDFSGWSFLSCEAVKHMTSDERRKARRAAERSSSGATAGAETSNSETTSESSLATPTGTG